MKQKDFIYNLILLIILNLLIKPFWVFGIDAGVQNSVGASQYGLYAAVFNFTFLFNMLLDMGITNFNNRNIAQHTQLLHKHLSGILTLKILLGPVYILAVFAIALLIGYGELQLKLLGWIAFNQFLNSFILYLRSNISGCLMFKTDSFLSILDRSLVILFCGILLWGNVTDTAFQIEWFVYCQTAAYFISACIALMIVLRKGRVVRLSWNYTFFKMILKKSFPFALLYFLMAFYNRIDSVMIERLLPDTIASYETGIYASAFRWLDALVMISYLFSVILLPLFSKMMKQKEDVVPIIKSSFSLLFVFSITATILLICYRIPVLDLIYTDHIEESAAVFRFLIPCIIPISFTYIFGTLLTANGNMKLLNITSLAGIGVNLLVNFIMIPHLHAVGAAIASLATQSVIAIIQIVLVSKALKFSLRVLPYWRGLLYIILLIVSTLLISHYLQINELLSLVIAGGVAILLALFTGLLPIGSIKKLVRRSESGL